MANDINDDMVMDLDLNQEPIVEPAPSIPSFGHGRIVDRLRHLEAVTARARQRQRWRQARNNPELSYLRVIETDNGAGNQNHGNSNNNNIDSNSNNNDDGDGDDDVVRVTVQEGVEERGRNSKRDISQLAKALEMDLDSEKKDDNAGGEDDESGGFFDCNICLEMARDPVLTCCGHLFCWCCFYQISYVDSSAKECPVCKGEVTDTSITPIYGNGKDQPVLKLESGVKIPPRPRARRVESIRQQRVVRGVSHMPVAEALRRIRIGIGAIGENPVFQGFNGVGPDTETNPTLVQNSEAGGSGGGGERRFHRRQVSRVISESAASLSSISFALNNAERLVEDLETYINDSILRRAEAHVLPSTRELNAFLTESQPEPQNAEMNSSLPDSSSSQRSVAVVHLDDISTDGSVEIDLTISQSHPSSSSRRTGGGSRGLGLEGGTSRELRRRRLR